MKKLAFRFDIDTHKCIRDGVPNLLKLSEEGKVGFSFFLNLGRAVSLKESLLTFFKGNTENSVRPEMMTAKEKFGIWDYLFAALINPPNYCYRKEIISLCNSSNEVGIHGGKNHALWQKNVKTWRRDQTKKEIEWSLIKLSSIVPGYKPRGFASPCWEAADELLSILKELGFSYSGDMRIKDCNSDRLIENSGILPKVGVNLLGEPGGVAFFENCRVKGWSTDRIIDYVLNSVKEHDMCVLYDHPYYAGIKEIDTIKKLIKVAKEKSIDILTLYDLINGGKRKSI